MRILFFIHRLLKRIWFMVALLFLLFFITIRLLSYLDIRYLDKGDQLHSDFTVILFNQINNSLRFVKLTEISNSLDKETFLASKPMGELDREGVSWSYKVLEDSSGVKQLIEVKQKEEDRTIWSTYWAEKTKIYPVKSQIFSFDFVFPAFIYTLGTLFCISIVNSIIGIFLNKKSINHDIK